MLDKTGMRYSIRGGGHLGKLQLVAVGPTNDKGQLRVKVLGHSGFTLQCRPYKGTNYRRFSGSNLSRDPWLLGDKDVVGFPKEQYKKNALLGMEFLIQEEALV